MKRMGWLWMALSFCCLSMAVHAADRVKGDGKLTTKSITIDDFNAVKMDGVIDFTYVQSDEASTIEITIDSNLHPYINIEVKDRVLSIDFKGAKVDHYTKFIVKTNSRWLSEARVYGNANFMVESKITGDELKIKTNDNSLVQFKKPVKVGKLDLNVSGSANIVMADIQAGKVDCDINGSGSITVKSGSVNEGSFNVLSSGDMHAFGLQVKQANCNMKGSGTIEIHATDNLKTSVVGKGKIRYKGSPSMDKNFVVGKGSVEQVK
ncbi:MAG: head GIN domain-containing protein [Parabacteroides sp.]